jgi:hypothetical protein
MAAPVVRINSVEDPVNNSNSLVAVRHLANNNSNHGLEAPEEEAVGNAAMDPADSSRDRQAAVFEAGLANSNSDLVVQTSKTTINNSSNTISHSAVVRNDGIAGSCNSNL